MSKKSTGHRKLYQITWLDHNTLSSGWKSIEDIDKLSEPSVVQSVGAIVKETPTMISLIHTYVDEGAALHGINILKSCIVSKKRMKVY